MHRLAVVLMLILVFGAGAPLRAEEPADASAALTSAFTYQGRLLKNGSPVNATCAMTFSLWDAPAAGVQVGGNQVLGSVAVADGLFTVTLNAANQFGANAFDGQARYLQTSVTCPGDGAPVVLSRQQLTAAPYALYAAGNWGLNGNAGTTTANRLGTTDSMTMTFVVSNVTGLRLDGQPPLPGVEFGPNVIGGASVNTVGANVQAAFIGGGGRASPGSPNVIYDSYGVIGGGLENTVGVNDGNPNNQNSSVVGGGFSNEATREFSVIGGGRQNAVAGSHGAVGGGQLNTINSAALYGTIPGGLSAVATQYGQLAHAGGQFNNVGDAQASEFILRNTTNSTTVRALYLDCNEQMNTDLDIGTPCTSGNELAVATGRAIAFTIKIVARIESSTNVNLPDGSTAAYFGSGLLRNNAGTTTLATVAALSEIGDTAAVNNFSVSLSVVSNALRITVNQGLANAIVRWVAVIETAEVAD